MASMTPEERANLEALNNQVKSAIAARTKWLDEMMEKYAEVKVGEEIYDLTTGQCLGVVTELYRYWKDRDEGIRDTSLNIQYQYQLPFGYGIDNTSRHLYVHFGSKEEALNLAKQKVAALDRRLNRTY